MKKTNRTSFQKKVEQVDAVKKVNPLDLSSDQDLTIGLMNLIAIEDMTSDNSELHKMINDIRVQLMSRIISPDLEDFNLSASLLGQTVRLMGAGAHKCGDVAYDLYDMAYGTYSAVWGLNMGLIGVDEAKKILNDAIKY